jgi:hypothetical protein
MLRTPNEMQLTRTNSCRSALSCGPQKPADYLKTRDQRAFLNLVTNKRPGGAYGCAALWSSMVPVLS